MKIINKKNCIYCVLITERTAFENHLNITCPVRNLKEKLPGQAGTWTKVLSLVQIEPVPGQKKTAHAGKYRY